MKSTKQQHQEPGGQTHSWNTFRPGAVQCIYLAEAAAAPQLTWLA
jgi:hypothetical protein